MACPEVATFKEMQLDQPLEGWHFFSKVLALLAAKDRATQAAESEAEQWLDQKEAQHPCPQDDCRKGRQK